MIIIRGIFLAFSLFLFFSVPSCQTLVEKNDNRLDIYLDRFEYLCTLYKVDCSKNDEYIFVVEKIPDDFITFFTKEKKKVIGRCNRILKRITIDEEFFKNSSNLEIEMVVLHEIGHCLFNKNHDDTTVSIMNTYSSTYYMYSFFYNYYLNDFFNCKQNCPLIKFDQEFYKKVLTESEK